MIELQTVLDYVGLHLGLMFLLIIIIGEICFLLIVKFERREREQGIWDYTMNLKFGCLFGALFIVCGIIIAIPLFSWIFENGKFFFTTSIGVIGLICLYFYLNKLYVEKYGKIKNEKKERKRPATRRRTRR